MNQKVMIHAVQAREILDSRGAPTVEVEVTLGGGAIGRAAVPAGASTGSREAVELRDGDERRYRGKGVRRALEIVTTVISRAVRGLDADDQAHVDHTLIELDGTPAKSYSGSRRRWARRLTTGAARRSPPRPERDR